MQLSEKSEICIFYFLGFESNGIMFEVISATIAAITPISRGLYGNASNAPPIYPITSPKINAQKITIICFILIGSFLNKSNFSTKKMENKLNLAFLIWW